MIIYVAILIAYLACSIPMGLVLTRIFLKQDVRKVGSGNIGATNVLRTGSKALAAATLVLDALKPWMAYYIIRIILFYYDLQGLVNIGPGNIKILAVVVAMIGHTFPIYLKFKGGKGVATALGAMFLFSPVWALASFSVWLFIAFAFKKSSLAALVAAICVPVLGWVFGVGNDVIALFVALVIFVIARHTGNILRLVKGEESNIKLGK